MIEPTSLYLALRRHYWRFFPSIEQTEYEMKRWKKGMVLIKKWPRDSFTGTFTLLGNNND